MNPPKRTTVKDVICYWRHKIKAYQAGFGDDVERHERFIRTKRHEQLRNRILLNFLNKPTLNEIERQQLLNVQASLRPVLLYDSALLAQSDLRKLGQRGEVIPISHQGQTNMTSLLGNVLGAAVGLRGIF